MGDRSAGHISPKKTSFNHLDLPSYIYLIIANEKVSRTVVKIEKHVDIAILNIGIDGTVDITYFRYFILLPARIMPPPDFGKQLTQIGSLENIEKVSIFVRLPISLKISIKVFCGLIFITTGHEITNNIKRLQSIDEKIMQ